MTRTDPVTAPPPAGPRLLRRAAWLTATAAALVLAWWLGLAVADTATAAHCFGSGGIWSEDFQVCECANYGGHWEGAQCFRPD